MTSDLFYLRIFQTLRVSRRDGDRWWLWKRKITTAIVAEGFRGVELNLDARHFSLAGIGRRQRYNHRKLGCTVCLCDAIRRILETGDTCSNHSRLIRQSEGLKRTRATATGRNRIAKARKRRSPVGVVRAVCCTRSVISSQRKRSGDGDADMRPSLIERNTGNIDEFADLLPRVGRSNIKRSGNRAQYERIRTCGGAAQLGLCNRYIICCRPSRTGARDLTRLGGARSNNHARGNDENGKG